MDPICWVPNESSSVNSENRHRPYLQLTGEDVAELKNLAAVILR